MRIWYMQYFANHAKNLLDKADIIIGENIYIDRGITRQKVLP